MGNASKGDFETDFVDHVGGEPLQQRHLEIVAVAPHIEPLPQPHGTKCVDTGSVGLAAAQQHQRRAPTADLGEQRPGSLHRGVPGKRMPHGDIHEPRLFRLVDDLKRDACPSANTIEKQVGIARLADRARRDGVHMLDAVSIHDAPETVERRQRRVDRLRSDGTGRERVAAEEHSSRRLLHNSERLAGRELRHHETNGARAHVEYGDQFRCGSTAIGHVRRNRL